MKKFIAVLLSLFLFIGMIPCAGMAESKPLTIVTTIFPIYDWARQIIGEDADAKLVLLLDNGVDLHSYQPSAQDIMTISTADLFIYVGGESDEWVEETGGRAVFRSSLMIRLYCLISFFSRLVASLSAFSS